MTERKYIITGINQLTGNREQLSRTMGKQEALERLEREKVSRRRQKYQAHRRLRVEVLQAVQLTLKFEDYE